jgi:hypothetical protein
LTNFNKNDLNYLSEHQTLTELSQNINSYPLLVYRIFSLQERFGDAQAIKKELERHQKNLERNIIRIYRLRNEIVHSAAKEKNIQEITAHLRYYVTFVINGFIDFALTCSPEINRDGKISLDDYYTLTSMQLDNLLIGNTISLKTLLKIKNPIHFLTEEPVIENVVGEQMIA